MNHDGPLFSSRHSVSRNTGARITWVSALTLGLGLLAACNAVTGAGDLRLEEVEEDDDTSGGQVLAGGGPSGGAGGSTSVSTSASTGGATACVYPEGTYGKEVGDLVSPSYKWEGYAEGTTGAAEISEISIESYLDCDGSKKINALMIIESAEWCGNCQEEAKQLNSKMANGWEEKGIRVLTLMAQNLAGQPATTAIAFKWKETYQLNSTAVAIDPPITFTPPGASSIGLPLIVVIDPRTMEIVHTQEGYSGTHPQLEQLAEKNMGSGL
jgi:hypothetical protein